MEHYHSDTLIKKSKEAVVKIFGIQIGESRDEKIARLIREHRRKADEAYSKAQIYAENFEWEFSKQQTIVAEGHEAMIHVYERKLQEEG